MSRQIETLIELRGRALEKRQAELAQKQSLCARVETNIARLGQLMQGVSPEMAVSTALVINASAYKQSLLELIDTQRKELTRCKDDATEARQAVNEAMRQQEVLSQLLAQTQARELLARSRQAQKAQDDLATQVWMRKQA